MTGVFTNTQDHLDYHHTFEAYRDAKKKLFSMSELAIVNMDDSYHKDMIEGIKSRAVSFQLRTMPQTILRRIFSTVRALLNMSLLLKAISAGCI